MTTVQDLAQEMSSAFERRKRDNGDTFVALKDDSPQWMTDVCHEAHGDMFPDDWRYSFIEDAVDALAENEDQDEARDSIEAEIYTHKLTSWLASRNDRYEYCDQALEEWGTDIGGTFPLLQMGQSWEKEEVFSLVLSALEALADEDEERGA
jgi:hypothetical protein